MRCLSDFKLIPTVFVVISGPWIENAALKCGMCFFKRDQISFTSGESSRRYDLQLWRKVNGPLSAYKDAFVFS